MTSIVGSTGPSATAASTGKCLASTAGSIVSIKSSSLVSTVGSTEASTPAAVASSVSTGDGTGSTGDSIVVSTAAAGTDEVSAFVSIMWADEDSTAAVSTLVSIVSAEVLLSIPSDCDADVMLVAEEPEDGGTGACLKLEAAGKTDTAGSVCEVVGGLAGRAVGGRGEEEEEVQDKMRGEGGE